MLVRIVKDWIWPNIIRQSPKCSGTWRNIKFTVEPVDRCDFLVVLNRPTHDLCVTCPPQHVWAIMQEPPNEVMAIVHRGDLSYHRVYTSDPTLKSKRYIQSHPALPWYVDKTYDFLSSCGVPEKRASVSWITSNKSFYKGHHARLRFLEKLRRGMTFELYGHGFRHVEDKWDALAPYRYSIAIENFRNPLYWSEKLADCFLSWTMPIYYGCNQITKYFPSESMILVDINDPDVVKRIKEVTSSDAAWRTNLDAIAYARTLVLEKYQLFPFLANEIHQHMNDGCTHKRSQTVFVPSILRPPYSLKERSRQVFRKLLVKL